MAEVDLKILRPPSTVSTSYNGTLPRECASLLENRGTLRIIDIGCGRALHRPFLTQCGHRYIGIDLTSPQADVCCDMHTMPFEDGKFDAALLFASLQYSLNPQLVLEETSRILCQGGTLTGCVAFLEPGVWGGLIHLSALGLRVLLEDAKFNLKYIWPSWNVFEAIASALRQMTTNSPERNVDVRRLEAAAHSAFSSIQDTLDFCGAIYFHAEKINSLTTADH